MALYLVAVRSVVLVITYYNTMASGTQWISIARTVRLYLWSVHIPQILNSFVYYTDNEDNSVVRQLQILKHRGPCLLVMIMHVTKRP